MAQGGVDHVGCVVCKLGRMCAFFFLFFFVMMHYSFSSGTHGKVFTKPSAKIARLNWADVQLLRKWMLFKGGQPVLHTCQCKRTQSASRCLPLSSSLYACVSEAHQSHVRSVPSSKKTPIIQCSVICCSFCVFWPVLYVWAISGADFMSLTSSWNHNKTAKDDSSSAGELMWISPARSITNTGQK